ncbi:hypothetical protein [Paraburkholderia phosphatilytica]|uniref:hypothetical protein n=1 Tax=Paraburkholderia phosphatilytica TaxID=2282883 RepID=UPI000E4BD0C9|nr:hypothetical protein [Paraburkholderia phosphatilytica]
MKKIKEMGAREALPYALEVVRLRVRGMSNDCARRVEFDSVDLMAAYGRIGFSGSISHKTIGPVLLAAGFARTRHSGNESRSFYFPAVATRMELIRCAAANIAKLELAEGPESRVWREPLGKDAHIIRFYEREGSDD